MQKLCLQRVLPHILTKWFGSKKAMCIFVYIPTCKLSDSYMSINIRDNRYEVLYGLQKNESFVDHFN